MKKTLKYIKKYGVDGIIISTKLKWGNTKNISIPNVSHPICLRNDTSDINTFHQIFNALEYDIRLDFSPQTIIDAGANIGLASIYFANKYPAAKIIAVEPESANFNLLKKNTAPYKNVYPLKRAISNESDQYLHIVDDGYGEWGFMTHPKSHSQHKNIKGSVKTITIEEIIKENNLPCIDILKIDIEGAEKELFDSNFHEWIAKTRCIIIELHDNMKKGASQSFFKVISQYNFSYSHRGENLVFINNDN